MTPKTASTSVQRRRVVVGEGGKSEVRWKENQYHLTLDWALPGNAGRSGNISNWLSDVKKKKRDYKRFVGFVDSVMQRETIAQFNAMSLNISNIHFFSYSWFDYFP